MFFSNVIKKSSQGAILGGSVLILSACGGINSTTTNGDSASASNSSLQILAPSTHVYDNNVFSDGIPFVIYNNGESALSNIKYSFRVNTFNSDTRIPDNCNSIPAKTSCNIIIPVSPNIGGAVFSLSAALPNSVSNLKASLQDVSVNNVFSNLTGIIPLEMTTSYGANGVMLYAPDTVIDSDGDNTNDTDVMVTAIVSPQNITPITALNLVDKNGNILKFQRLSTNTGTIITPGSVVTFMLELPGGTVSQDVYIQVTDANAVTRVSDSAINIKVIAKDSNIGILNQSPTLSKLSVGKSSQVVYINNTGVGTINNLLINVKDSNLKINNNNCDGKTLNPKDFCSYTVSFDPNLVTASKGEIVASYDNSLGSFTNSIYVMYSGISPNAAVELSAVGGFTTTVQNPSQSQTITIKNNGNTSVKPIKPLINNTYFTILPADASDCFSGRVLASGHSCNFKLNYNSGNIASANGLLNLGLDFTYNIGQGDVTYHYDQPVYYNTTAIGVISSQQSIINFTNILNDGIAESSVVLKLVNTGTGVAKDISFALTGDNPANIYTYSTSGVSNACGTSLNVGASCNVLVKFGATTQAVSESALVSKLNIFYKPQLDSTFVNYQVELTGNVIASKSANIILSNISSTFASGNGSTNSPYTTVQGLASPHLVYTFTNVSKYAMANKLSFNLANTSWNISGGTCNTKGYLESNNDSCTVVLALDTATAGNKNINANDLSVSWVDTSNMSQMISTNIYAQVLSLANVVTSLSGTGYQLASDGTNLVKPQTSYSVNLTLTNSILNNVTVTPTVHTASGHATLSPAGCTLSNTNKVCTLSLTTANNALGAGDFSLSFSSNHANYATHIESLAFHTWSGSLPNALNTYTYGITSHNNYLYLGYSNGTNNNLRKCSVLSNGNVYSCVDASSTTNPFTYSFTTQFSGNKAYLGHYASGGWGGVQFQHLSVCDVNQNSGMFENCVTDTNIMNEIGNGSPLHGIAVYKPTTGNEVLYISTFYNLYACVLNSDGAFNYQNCRPQLGENSYISDLYINGNFIYYGVYISNTLNRCNIDITTGSLSNCTNITPQLFSGATQVGFQSDLHSGSMLNVGNYFYAIQAYTRNDGYAYQLSICPTSSSITNSSVCNIQNNGNVYTIAYLNGYMYLGGKKYQIATDGTLINQTSIVGY